MWKITSVKAAGAAVFVSVPADGDAVQFVVADGERVDTELECPQGSLVTVERLD